MDHAGGGRWTILAVYPGGGVQLAIRVLQSCPAGSVRWEGGRKEGEESREDERRNTDEGRFRRRRSAERQEERRPTEGKERTERVQGREAPAGTGALGAEAAELRNGGTQAAPEVRRPPRPFFIAQRNAQNNGRKAAVQIFCCSKQNDEEDTALNFI